MNSATIVVDGVSCKIVKVYQYKTVVMEDRGHISDPRFLEVLNREATTGADGWRHKEEQVVGASRLAILVERELAVDGQLPDDGAVTSGPGSVEDADGLVDRH